VTLKLCTACATELPLSGFNRDRSKPDGLQNRCRSCSAAYNREWKASATSQPSPTPPPATGDRMIDALLRGDFAEYCRVCPETNALVGRGVSHESVVAAWDTWKGSRVGYLAFARGTFTRWKRWRDQSPLDHLDRMVWSRSVRLALGERYLY